ncbi:MAG: hypothetical protein KAI79_09190 [Bacteroidales bacterium]|nr:hypothetical protein [Bacteroidales bacterium]
MTDQDLYNELERLSVSQQRVLARTYNTAKQYNLEYTMTAMAWNESRFGLKMENKRTKDYGVFGINLKSFKSRFGHKLKGLNASDKAIKTALKESYELNFKSSLAEIRYWQKHRNGNWQLVVRSYNAGWNHSNGKRYAKGIARHIRILKLFFKNNPEILEVT